MSRPRLSQQELEEHSRKLVEAAFSVAAATGRLDPPVREILREAGLSRQALYRCYDSKAALIAAALVEGTRTLAEYLAARVDRAGTPADRVQAWISGVMRQAEAPRAAARTRPFVLAGMGWRDRGGDPLEVVQIMVQPLEASIIAGVSDGSLVSTDPAGDAVIIHDFVFASMRRFLVANERPPAALAQQLGDFALRSLGAHASTPVA